MLKNVIVPNRYFDSATLMLLTNKMKARLELSQDDIAIMMGTPMNLRIMEESGLLTDEGRVAKPGDVLIGVKTDLAETEILALLEELLSQKAKKSTSTAVELTSVAEALDVAPASNFAVVSLPGAYAARETKKLLEAGKNVLLFSDNVSIEDEVKLKKLALSKDLLMMGPDCGTAIIHGVGLGFSNKVRRGPVGIVAASGTGLQEVATLIHNAGSGISHALGTGGRDIKDAVGGLMMLYGLELLSKDPETEVIVLVAKPPEASVLAKLVEAASQVTKPIVACFLGADEIVYEGTSIRGVSTLADAAQEALRVVGISSNLDFDVEKVASTLCVNAATSDLRAIYCGGTLAYEALLMLKHEGYEVFSNLAKDEAHQLGPKDVSRGHTVLDMGDDAFTVGKPHPMIDPTLRSARLREEAKDPKVRIILADVELGYGSFDGAAEQLALDFEAIRAARPDVVVIGVVCGSHDDYQGYGVTCERLQAAGAMLAPSNAAALRLALRLLKKE